MQRAFRAWRAQCQRVGWPSDENPWHWKHWTEFRQQYGWADSELYDEYGEVRERTDGGRPLKGKNKQKENAQVPIVEHASYMDAIGHFKERYGRLPLDGDELLIAALQSQVDMMNQVGRG